MSPVEIIRSALRGVRANLVRSMLTTLGILIGVAAVILLTAIGEGARSEISGVIEDLGSNTLTITADRGTTSGADSDLSGLRSRDPGLRIADADALEDPDAAPDVRSASPVVVSVQTARFGEDAYSIGTFIGSEPSYLPASNSTVAFGRSISEADVTAARRVLVIGVTVVEQLFDGVDPIGQRVVIDGVPFTVVGVMEEKGASGFGDADDVAIAPISAVQQSLIGYGDLSQIVVQATSADTVNAAEIEVAAILNQRRGITDAADADYDVFNQATLLETVEQATAVLTVMLAGIAAISLVVGGVGIMNIMLVTVTERTREIGIRKAIGAPRGAILAQFLTESILLSAVGGSLGIALGWLGAQVPLGEVTPEVVPSSVVLAFTVSVAIGLFFGSYPANRAASLRPIEALRHE